MKNIHEIKAVLEDKRRLLREQKSAGHVGNIKNLECQINVLEWVLDIK